MSRRPTRVTVWILIAAAVAVPVALLLLAQWLLSAVGAEGPQVGTGLGGRARPQGDVLVGAFAEPADSFPLTSDDAVARAWVLRYTHETLLDFDPATGDVRDALARSWHRDGDVVTVELRDDARFSDGEPLVADDVVTTWRCATAPGLRAGAAARAAAIAAALTALGPHSLRVELAPDAPRPRWPRFATGMWVMQGDHLRRLLGDVETGSPRCGEILSAARDPGPGSGPYRVAAGAAAGPYLDLVAWPGAWVRRARPLAWNLAGMRLRFVPDGAGRLAALRDGSIDWLAEGDLRELLRREPAIAARCTLHSYDYRALGHHMVVWNLRRPYLADAGVRRALGMLFDREAIAERLLDGDARPAAAWFRPGSAAYPDDLRPLPHDPTAARELLQRAGDAAPTRLELLVAAESPLHRRIAELAQPSFAAAGVELSITSVDFAALVTRLRAREFDGVLLLKFHDAWIDPRPYFHSSQAGPGGQNWAGLADDAVDDLLDRAQAADDDGARDALHAELARALHRLQPIALLVHPRATVLLDRRFRDAEPGPLGLVPEAWWVPPDAQRYRR